jgi:hypothetical protein
MQYDLAKQLRDAGFPQSGNGRWIGPPDKIVWRSGDRAYVPTLEELIAACGRNFIALSALGDDGGGWCAMGTGFRVGTIEDKSPSEAVAKLWLGLNKVQ